VTNVPPPGTPGDFAERYLALSAEYEQFRYHLPDALVEVELPSTRVTYLNRMAETLLGYSVEDVLTGIVGAQLLDEESWQRATRLGEEDFARQVHRGLPYERLPGQHLRRFTAIRKDGTPFPIEAQASYIVDDRGMPVGARFLFRDVSDRLAREQEHTRLAAIVESAEDAIVSRDREGRILSWNRGAEKLYGWTATEMIGRTADVLAPPGHEGEVRELAERAKRGERVQVTTRRQRRDGSIFDIELSIFPVHDEAGKVAAIGGIGRDIAERLRVTAELERTNRLLAALTRAQADFIREGEPSGVFQALLDLILELTESQQGCIGEVQWRADGRPELEARALVGPRFEKLAPLVGQALGTGEPVIVNEPEAGAGAEGPPVGQPRLVSFLALPITSRGEVVGLIGLANRPGGYPGGALDFLRPLATTCATFIEAIRSERRRLETERRLDSALERSEIALWEWDIPGGRLVAFAGDADRLAPFDPRVEAWLERTHPGDRERTAAAFRAHVLGESERIEVEHRFLVPGGHWRWMLTRGRVVERDANGAPLRAAGSFLDVSRQKEAELDRTRLELQVRQAQKLESLGVLAGGIAHDFNNLLTAVHGNLYLLRQALPPDPALLELLDDAAHAAERGADLVRRLLAYGRPDLELPQVVELGALIAEAAALARPMVEPQVRLVVRRGRGPAHAKGSASALAQVLVNLFVNARDAMPDGGVITVTRSTVELAARRRWAPPELPRGRYHAIAVGDTGTGIPPAIMERIFDPFFTTKPVGRGSGLGLPTALAIARAHGGWLSAESTPGRGSTFRLLLPALEGETAG
jgi:PAS domain S-box-containing protein